MEGFIEEIRREFPDFKLVPKSESAFMKFLHVCLLIITFGGMKTFMSDFTTTVGFTIYTPADWDARSETNRFVVLRHERVHLRQLKRLGRFWFSISYMLLPFPTVWAYYRMKYEMEAYEESIRAKWEYYGARGFTPKAKEAMIKRFTGPSYFWTWPWSKRIEKWYDDAVIRFAPPS